VNLKPVDGSQKKRGTPMNADFSNPASTASDEAERYISRLLELLGDRDPIEVQKELAPRLRELVEGLDGSALRQPEAPGQWSILEVLGHLADTEVVYRYRMRMSVAQPGSAIPNYDQDLWAAGLRYNDASLEDALEQIDAWRTANLDWLSGLSDEEMSRAGIHEERGEESVDQIVRLLAAHDLVHRNQIRRIRAAL
jgi:uncharacterized damage-inducible protein DinB